MLGKVGQRQADVRQEGAGQDIDFFTREQLFSGTHGFAGVGVVITNDQLKLFAVDAACGIDLFNRQVHAFLVGLEKSGLGFVAVDLTDLDDALRMRQRRHQADKGCRADEFFQLNLHVYSCWLWIEKMGAAYLAQTVLALNFVDLQAAHAR